MRDLLDDLHRWRVAGRRAALARVVGVSGSAPRGPGAAMAVADDGAVAGSVSGGCVEGAVVEQAGALLRGERAAGRLTYGISDDDGFVVGLTCGGTIDVFVSLVTWSTVEVVIPELREHRPVGVATVVRSDDDGVPVGADLVVRPGAGSSGSLGTPRLDEIVTADLVASLEVGASGLREYGLDSRTGSDGGHVEVFLESHVPPPRMWIFGAVDFAAALAAVARVVGYRVSVCDARGVFATRARFPEVDELVVAWPDRMFAEGGHLLTARDAVCILTHDPKFDVPAIAGALATDVGYIGVLGSRRAHASRLERLAEAGIDSEVQLGRVRAPIGLDLGARTPEETAVAICAEIIAQQTGRSALPLTATTGRIRHVTTAP